MEGSVKQETSMSAAETRSPVRSWRIHLGAHKTATTHLQETLTAVRPALAERGIDFIPNQLVRGRGLAQTLWRRRPIARLPIVGPAHMREAIEATLDPIRIGPDTVVLSEENILGLPRQILEVPFYAQTASSVARLASLGQKADLKLFLSIRGYDRLLPSAYAEALKHAPPEPGGFARVKAQLLAQPPSWYDLVARIRKAAPGVSLKIWRQEDYRANALAIMETVCGCPLGPLPEISDPAWTRSPSATAIAAVEQLPPDIAAAERQRRVREIFAASAPGDDPFRPFSAAERQRLRGDYEADLGRIAQVFPDTLMQFASHELAA
jgi:hypothetical protein